MASGERSEAPTAAGASSSRIQQLSFSCAVVFLRLSPIGGSGEGKIHQCDGCCAGGAGRSSAARAAKRPQAFGCSGSSSEGEGSKTAAGVRLFGLQQGGNVKERKRENPIFAAGKIMPWPSVALIDPSHRQQIKGTGGRRRRKKKGGGRRTIGCYDKQLGDGRGRGSRRIFFFFSFPPFYL